MKIAYVYDVIHPYVIGGVQRRIWELATRLAKRGHDVTVFGMKHWEGSDVMEKDGVRLWGVCHPQPLFVNGRRSTKQAVSFALQLLPPLMKEKYDVLDVANFPYFPCFAGALHHVARGSCLVITWHEVWNDYWYEYMGKVGAFGKAVERLTARLPHRAIAVSDRTRLGMERLGLREVQVIPSGVDLHAIQEAAPSATGTDVIFVGRMTKEKNVSILIEALRLIKDQGTGLSCLLVGDGPEKPRLQSLIAGIGPESNICFRDNMESSIEVFSLMKSSGVLVLPSVREGLGLVVIEANACGIPVVTVRHPNSAASDLVVEGENGFACCPSAADLAEKILAAIDRTQPWEDACRKHAQDYDWEVITDSVEKVYQRA